MQKQSMNIEFYFAGEISTQTSVKPNGNEPGKKNFILNEIISVNS